jgi:hypothetical protein
MRHFLIGRIRETPRQRARRAICATYRKAQAACRDLEDRYGLYRVAPPGTGSRRWPNPAELNKAARLDAASSGARPGRQASRRSLAPREVLRRRVRGVATVATDEADFFDRLAHAGRGGASGAVRLVSMDRVAGRAPAGWLWA